MASELECSQVDRSPPIRSGYYYIVNRVNGNINLQLEDDNDPTEIPVVANLDSVAEIWKIEHIKNRRDDYHIIAQIDGHVLESAIDEDNLLYVDIDAQPEIWVICGEYDATSGENIYIIKKFIDSRQLGPPSATEAWALKNSHPGTQVQVTQPPGPGCEVNRIPKEYTWFIRECIPSGKYSIVNTLNKSIYLPVIDPERTEIPVVADPGSLTWEIQHIKNYDYHLFAPCTCNSAGRQPESAVERGDLLYVDSNTLPDVWVICGEYDPKYRENIYTIMKKFIDPSSNTPPERPLKTKAWMLEDIKPGTQVQVTQLPLFPGREYAWFIKKANV